MPKKALTEKTPARRWNDIGDAEREALYDSMLGGVNVAVLAESANYAASPEAFARRLREWAQMREKAPKVLPTGRFAQHYDLLCKFIGRKPSQALPRSKARAAGDWRRIVTICDLHGYPLHELIASALAEDPTMVVLDGDVFDAYAFSHWEKDHASPIADEVARVRACLEVFVGHGVKVLMNSGNHDDRAKKYFARRVDSAFMPLVKYNLLEMAALGLEGVEVVQNTYDFTTGTGRVFEASFRNNWLIHLGDALIGHAETARRGEIRSVDAFAHWARQWQAALGWGDIRLFIQAHVHRAGISYPRGGCEVHVEGGFGGDLRSGLLQYTHDYGVTSYPPPVIGYTVFDQANQPEGWRTDLASVRFQLC